MQGMKKEFNKYKNSGKNQTENLEIKNSINQIKKHS
jgi:hypothetical protein